LFCGGTGSAVSGGGRKESLAKIKEKIGKKKTYSR